MAEIIDRIDLRFGGDVNSRYTVYLDLYSDNHVNQEMAILRECYGAKDVRDVIDDMVYLLGTRNYFAVNKIGVEKCANQILRAGLVKGLRNNLKGVEIGEIFGGGNETKLV